MKISRSLVVNFYKKYNMGGYPYQRIGQAFYHHFELHKSEEWCGIGNTLYEKDGDEARALIDELTDWEN